MARYLLYLIGIINSDNPKSKDFINNYKNSILYNLQFKTKALKWYKARRSKNIRVIFFLFFVVFLFSLLFFLSFFYIFSSFFISSFFILFFSSFISSFLLFFFFCFFFFIFLERYFLKVYFHFMFWVKVSNHSNLVWYFLDQNVFWNFIINSRVKKLDHFLNRENYFTKYHKFVTITIHFYVTKECLQF